MVSVASLYLAVFVSAFVNDTQGIPVRTKESSSTDPMSMNAAEVPSPTQLKSGVQDVPSEFKCGSRPLRVAARVVGGSSANEGDWPWQVILKEVKYFGLITGYKCGGVLISDRHVLTAAHCKPESLFTTMTATLGQHEINEKSIQTIPVKKMTIHEEFNRINFNNDLAVLELEYPVSFSSRILPICLPDATDDFIGQIGHVSGWGKLSYGGRFPKGLQSVELPIIPRDVCQRMFEEKGHNLDIHDHFLCAGGGAGQFDACEGDSGGPLSVRRSNGQWVLAGTVSHGVKCAQPGLAGVYVNVPQYKSWIQRAMSLPESQPRDPAQSPFGELTNLYNGRQLNVVYLS